MIIATIPSYLAVLGSMVGVAGAAGVAWGILRSSSRTSATSVLLQENDALARSRERYETENQSLRDQLEKEKQTSSQLRKDLDFMSRMVTGTDAVMSVGSNMDDYYADIAAMLEQLGAKRPRRRRARRPTTGA